MKHYDFGKKARGLAVLLCLVLLHEVALAAKVYAIPLNNERLADWKMPFDAGISCDITQGNVGAHIGAGYCLDLVPNVEGDVAVYAPFTGEVVQTTASILDGQGIYSAKGTQTYGNFVHLIDPESGYSVILAHLKSGSVPFDQLNVGQVVEQGTQLGIISGSGSADALQTIEEDYWSPHLHFEIRPNVDVRKPSLDQSTSIGGFQVANLVKGFTVTGGIEQGGAVNSHTYAYYKADVDWMEAQRLCTEMGGHLVTITSQQEYEQVLALLEDGETHFVWLGATDREVEGDWRWVTGEPFDFAAWLEGEPNGDTQENYLLLTNYYYDTWGGNDGTEEAITGLQGYVCEWDGVDAQAPGVVNDDEAPPSATVPASLSVDDPTSMIGRTRREVEQVLGQGETTYHDAYETFQEGGHFFIGGQYVSETTFRAVHYGLLFTDSEGLIAEFDSFPGRLPSAPGDVCLGVLLRAYQDEGIQVRGHSALEDLISLETQKGIRPYIRDGMYQEYRLRFVEDGYCFEYDGYLRRRTSVPDEPTLMVYSADLMVEGSDEDDGWYEGIRYNDDEYDEEDGYSGDSEDGGNVAEMEPEYVAEDDWQGFCYGYAPEETPYGFSVEKAGQYYPLEQGEYQIHANSYLFDDFFRTFSRVPTVDKNDAGGQLVFRGPKIPTNTDYALIKLDFYRSGIGLELAQSQGEIFEYSPRALLDTQVTGRTIVPGDKMEFDYAVRDVCSIDESDAFGTYSVQQGTLRDTIQVEHLYHHCITSPIYQLPEYTFTDDGFIAYDLSQFPAGAYLLVEHTKEEMGDYGDWRFGSPEKTRLFALLDSDRERDRQLIQQSSLDALYAYKLARYRLGTMNRDSIKANYVLPDSREVYSYVDGSFARYLPNHPFRDAVLDYSPLYRLIGSPVEVDCHVKTDDDSQYITVPVDQVASQLCDLVGQTHWPDEEINALGWGW